MKFKCKKRCFEVDALLNMTDAEVNILTYLYIILSFRPLPLSLVQYFELFLEGRQLG